MGHVSRERLSNADTAAEADGGGGGDDDEVDLMDTSGDGEGGCGAHARVAVPSAAAAASELPAFDIAPMPLQVRFTLGPASGAPAEAAAPSLAFDDERTLLHSLQQLREANQALGLESNPNPKPNPNPSPNPNPNPPNPDPDPDPNPNPDPDPNPHPDPNPNPNQVRSARGRAQEDRVPRGGARARACDGAAGGAAGRPTLTSP